MAPPSEDATETLSLPKASAEYDSFYSNVYHVIRDDATPIVKNTEVRNVLQLIEQMFEQDK